MKHIKRQFTFERFPDRNGVRPKTIVGPLHIQYSGHGDSKYLNQLVKDVLTWAYIDRTASSGKSVGVVCFRLEETATANQPSAFIGAREFARVHLGVPTIVLALPLVWAHCAIVRGWAEPHYLRSSGLLPAGAVLLYSPRNPEELAVCYFLFSESYRFACKFVFKRPVQLDQDVERQREETQVERNQTEMAEDAVQAEIASRAKAAGRTFANEPLNSADSPLKPTPEELRQLFIRSAADDGCKTQEDILTYVDICTKAYNEQIALLAKVDPTPYPTPEKAKESGNGSPLPIMLIGAVVLGLSMGFAKAKTNRYRINEQRAVYR